MWKLCVVFSFFRGTARQPNRVFGNFWSLLSGWNLSIQKPPNVFSSPTSKSQRHVVFMWFPPVSSSCDCMCVVWLFVLLSWWWFSSLWFLCLPFVNVYDNISGEDPSPSPFSFLFPLPFPLPLLENLVYFMLLLATWKYFSPPLIFFLLLPCRRNCQPHSHRSYEVFFLFFFSASRRRSEEIERHVAIKFLIKLLDFTSTLFSVVAAEWQANWAPCAQKQTWPSRKY